jgi:hypothetical protein
MPRQWKKDKAKYREIFPELETEVNVHISIKGSCKKVKTIEVKK